MDSVPPSSPPRSSSSASGNRQQARKRKNGESSSSSSSSASAFSYSSMRASPSRSSASSTPISSSVAASRSKSVRSYASANTNRSHRSSGTKFSAMFGNQSLPVSQFPAPSLTFANNNNNASSNSNASNNQHKVGRHTNRIDRSKTVIVNNKQKGNPLLNHIVNVPCVFGDIVPDFVVGETACCLYLSLKYHRLFPKYIHYRIGTIQRLGLFTARILLCHVDVEDNQQCMQDLTAITVDNGWTMIATWSLQETGRYIETLKAFEKKSADMIKEKVNSADQKEMTTAALTTIRSVNKTDVATLISHFGSFSGISRASMEQLAQCPGIGSKKVHNLHNCFRQSFLKSNFDSAGD